MHQNKRNIFGEARLIFLSEVRKLSYGDVSSVESRKEKKVEDTVDEEGKVTKKGREAATWSVNELVGKANATIQARSAGLSEISQSFNDALKSAIVNYIKNSPGRFESDEFQGLSNAEYSRFSTAMHTQVSKLVEDYAPTEKELAAKRAAESAGKALKGSKEVLEVSLEDIKDDPGEIKDLKALSGKIGEFSDWNAGLHKEGNRVMKYGADFQKKYVAFKKAREGMKVYKKFWDYIDSDDELKNVNAVQDAAKRQLDSAIKKFEDAQKKLDAYGKKMAQASNKQKQERLKERDDELKRIDADEKLSKEEKAKKKETYELLKHQKTKLTGQRDSLEEYHKGLTEVKATKLETELTEDQKRKAQLEYYNGYLSYSIGEIDKMLKDPRLGKTLIEQLQETRKQLVEKQKGGEVAAIQIEAKITGGTDLWDKLTQEEKTVAENTNKIDVHIQRDVIPTMARLDQHIGLLDSAMIQYTSSKKEVNDHYSEVFKVYDQVDQAVDSAILSQSVANAKMLSDMRSQRDAIGSMTLESTTLWQASVGLPFAVAGAGLSGLAHEMIANSAYIDKELTTMKEEGVSPARYWAGKIGLEVLSAPMGAVAGALEMVGGLGTMIGDPAAAANGMGALIGRDPSTGEWSFGMAGKAWKGMGKAIISYDDFEKGQIGVGIGKIFTNVVTTLVGGGAAAQGVKAAGTAGREALVASLKAAAEALEAQGLKMGLEGAALKTFVKAGLESAKWEARFAALGAGAKAFGKGFVDSIVDDVVVGTKKAAAVPKRAWEAVKAAPGAIRKAAATAYELGPRGIMRNFADDLASRSAMAERLFGKEAAKRGLSRRNKALLDDIARGSDKVKKYNEMLEELRQQYPKLSETQLQLKLRRKDPVLFDDVAKLQRKIGQAMENHMRMEGDYHTDVDQLSGMRKKQMLYTKEGMEFLADKFGDDVNMVFGDVTGMGIGNMYLHGPGEGAAEAMATVDEMFRLMKEVADEVFKGRPIEVVRFGGDEIVFLTKKGDASLMEEFFKEFNKRKADYLKEKIGIPAYEKAKYETNVKGQQKLIDKDPAYHQALNGGEEALRDYFTKHLGEDAVKAAGDDFAAMNRALAEKRVAAMSQEQLLEPLDFYRAPDKTVGLKGPEAHNNFMRQLAEADSDIAWAKAHPGQKPPKNRAYGEDVAKAHADYITEAQGIEANAAQIKELQGQLKVAEQLGHKAEAVKIQRQITVLRTKDPGTGAIRLDNGKHVPMQDLMPIPEGTEELHVMKVDVNYFGAYNNNYWMSKADEMMTELKAVAEKAYGGDVMVVRDGGKFYFVSKKKPSGAGFAKLQEDLNDAIKPYVEGLGNAERRSALRLEMERKMRAKGAGAPEIGTVQMFEAGVVKVEEGATLMETIGEYDGRLERSAMRREQIAQGGLEKPGPVLDELGGQYQAFLEKFDQIGVRLKTATDEQILKVLAEENPELYETAKLIEDAKPELAAKIKEQHGATEKVNKVMEEDGVFQALDRVGDGKGPLTAELVDEALKSPKFTQNLEALMNVEPPVKLDWRLGSRESLMGRIKAAKEIHADMKVVNEALEGVSGAQGAKMLDDAFAKVAKGEKLGEADGLAKTLENFKKRDPQTFELLKNTDSLTLVESDCLEAVMSGTKLETAGQKGSMTVYIGKRNLGQGGFGSVDEVLFVREGETKFTRGAFKRANKTESAMRLFKEEQTDALRVQKWDHPNIIKVLDVGEDFILTETGSKAASMEKLGDVPPAEFCGMYMKAVEGIEYIWGQGYFHGDFKLENVIAFTQDGKRVVKVIDHTPNALTATTPRVRTPGFCFEQSEVTKGLQTLHYEMGYPQDVAKQWVSRAHDARSLGLNFSRYVGAAVDATPSGLSRLSAYQRQLINRMVAMQKKAVDIIQAGNPKFIAELKQIITDVQAEFAACAADPSRTQFHNFGNGVSHGQGESKLISINPSESVHAAPPAAE